MAGPALGDEWLAGDTLELIGERRGLLVEGCRAHVAEAPEGGPGADLEAGCRASGISAKPRRSVHRVGDWPVGPSYSSRKSDFRRSTEDSHSTRAMRPNSPGLPDARGGEVETTPSAAGMLVALTCRQPNHRAGRTEARRFRSSRAGRAPIPTSDCAALWPSDYRTCCGALEAARGLAAEIRTLAHGKCVSPDPAHGEERWPQARLPAAAANSTRSRSVEARRIERDGVDVWRVTSRQQRRWGGARRGDFRAARDTGWASCGARGRAWEGRARYFTGGG